MTAVEKTAGQGYWLGTSELSPRSIWNTPLPPARVWAFLKATVNFGTNGGVIPYEGSSCEIGEA